MREDVRRQFDKVIAANNLKSGTYLTGCDWSHWQHTSINSDMSDYDFFIHKLTEGETYIDPECKRRILALCDNKPCIVYHFFSDNKPGIRQADHFKYILHDFFKGKRIGICVDFEPKNETPAILDQYKIFLARMEKYGYNVITYCGDYSAARTISNIFGWPLWVARWRAKRPNTPCKLWQFTNAPYDLDIFFGKMEDLSLMLQWIE